jgi:hypothetical protein
MARGVYDAGAIPHTMKLYGFRHSKNGSRRYEKELRATCNWRLLIGSVLILCAGMGLATANDFVIFLSDAIDAADRERTQQLVVLFVDREGPLRFAPDLSPC